MKKITKKKPVLWGTSIIGFDSYHYKSERSRQEGDWPMAGFSPRNGALSIYLMGGVKKYGTLLKKLGKHKTGVCCLYIKKLDDVDLGVLEDVIARDYEYMKKTYSSK